MLYIFVPYDFQKIFNVHLLQMNGIYYNWNQYIAGLMLVVW